MTESLHDKTFFVEIMHISPAGSNSQKQMRIHGKFHFPYDKAGTTVCGSEVLKHVVLVVTRSGNYQAVTPFKDVIVFEDDVKETQDGCTGLFNFNVFDKILFDGAGDYYILCSIGTITSNILKVTV